MTRLLPRRREGDGGARRAALDLLVATLSLGALFQGSATFSATSTAHAWITSVPETTTRSRSLFGRIISERSLQKQKQHHAIFSEPLKTSQRAASASTRLSMVASTDVPPTAPAPAVSDTTDIDVSSLLGDDGLYHITTQAEHSAFLQANRDKLIILKVFAPWCRACKGLEPKFLQMKNDEKYKDLPLVFCDLTIQHNKDFVKNLGVLALPTIQFYVGGALYDTFANGPSKMPILKKKVAQLVKEHVDPKTRQVKETSLKTSASTVTVEPPPPAVTTEEAEPSTTAAASTTVEKPKEAAPSSTDSATVNTTAVPSRTFATTPQTTTPTTAPRKMPEEERQRYRRTIPYFSELSLADLDQVLDKAVLLTFEPGSIIMREGNDGRTFYIIQSGEVEICQSLMNFADPLLQTPRDYLGTVINRLEEPGDYFGERALITGEPRAASIRATHDGPVTCWALDKNDFPYSSALSGRTRNTANVAANKELYDDKYGVELDDLYDNSKSLEKQMQEVKLSNQVRGSVNTPETIKGVDTDEELDLDELLAEDDVEIAEPGADATLVNGAATAAPDVVLRAVSSSHEDDILHVLTRFQLIRHVSRCLDYILQSRGTVSWGNAGLRKRRAMLVNRLTTAQRDTFADAFQLVDADGNGRISLNELQRVMEQSLGSGEASFESSSSTSPSTMMMSSFVGPGNSTTNAAAAAAARNDVLHLLQSRPLMNEQDFMGLMAEAEFYYLFRDIFSSLDPHQSGFVKAKELDRVLCGVRDLISDDRKSIIDVEDDEMLIDYEKFSRMLLGSTLL